MSKASSGRDATRPRGRPNPVRVDDYGRSGSPSYPAKFQMLGGYTKPGVGAGAVRKYGRPLDEIDRSSVKTSASARTDNYTGPGSVTQGPKGPRSPRSYKDQEGVA
jgi:hypothetical protein